jgi:hypothetical protein
MTKIDTSAAEVKRLATECDSWQRAAYGGGMEWAGNAAATLRALVAERDRWQAQHAAAMSVADSRLATLERAEADRDRLAARVAELEGALGACQIALCRCEPWDPKQREATFRAVEAALAGSARDDR